MSTRSHAPHQFRDRQERPPSGLSVDIADATTEPITDSEVEAWLRVDISYTEQQTVIDLLRTDVRQEAEKITRRLFTQREVTAEWDEWHVKGELPYPPIQSVSSVESYDEDTGSWKSITDYDRRGQTLTLDNGQGGTPIRVTYTAGYGSVPAALKKQMLRDIRHNYDHRDPGTDGAARVQAREPYQQFRAH